MKADNLRPKTVSSSEMLEITNKNTRYHNLEGHNLKRYIYGILHCFARCLSVAVPNDMLQGGYVLQYLMIC